MKSACVRSPRAASPCGCSYSTVALSPYWRHSTAALHSEGDDVALYWRFDTDTGCPGARYPQCKAALKVKHHRRGDWRVTFLSTLARWPVVLGRWNAALTTSESPQSLKKNADSCKLRGYFWLYISAESRYPQRRSCDGSSTDVSTKDAERTDPNETPVPSSSTWCGQLLCIRTCYFCQLERHQWKTPPVCGEVLVRVNIWNSHFKVIQDFNAPVLMVSDSGVTLTTRTKQRSHREPVLTF